MATARQRQVTAALSAEVRSLAGRRNLKAYGLSRLTGIPKSTMANIWNGQTAIDVDQIAAISVALGVDPGQLLVNAIANAQVPGPDSGIHPDDADVIDSSDKLTKRQRAQVKRTLKGERDATHMTDMLNQDESVGSSVRRPRSAGTA